MARLRSRTVGRRFTILYATVFLLSGIGLIALIYLFSRSDTTLSAPGQPPPGAPSTGVAQHVLDLERQLADVHAQQSRQLLFGSLIAILVMAAVSLLLGRILAGHVLRPLRLITAATRRISADTLDQRLAVAGPEDEVKELADTVDGLLARLEASFAAQRRFVANASHELRTPLTTIRASLDVAVAKPQPAAQTVALAGRVRTELDRVDRLLEGFLVLARAQHGVLPDRVPVSLAELAGEALAARAAAVAEKDLTVEDGLAPRAWTRGSPALLSRLVQNLTDNAIVHNQRGGWIRITTEDGATTEGGATEDGAGTSGTGADDASWARLVVETGGSVLDQEQVDRLTQPFERLGTDRTGSQESSGLGLSIVAAIVSAHGGRLDLRVRPEGGLKVTAAMPSAEAPAAPDAANGPDHLIGGTP
ncbi:HAMP domain-containing sensor histidine kinase [Streptomyces sp. G1]|uniref:sensor histidine kinase n=1 Tax=Streptomyces sp. G1 TaxID=361572 RepID=UPI00202FC425|nr:ATP-binding protein [Streptomyces sp. G1]MCM1975518.1 ATP-binding protein [Streptomyces sp. G1]